MMKDEEYLAHKAIINYPSPDNMQEIKVWLHSHFISYHFTLVLSKELIIEKWFYMIVSQISV